MTTRKTTLVPLRALEFMVVDSNGTSSNIASRTSSCRNDPR